jgi:hypothetical protein
MTADGMTTNKSLTPALLMAHVRYQVSRHGWPVVLGIALLFAALGLQLWGVNTARAQVEKLGIEQAALRQRMAQRPVVMETKSALASSFYAALPTAPGALQAVEVIHRTAAAHQVRLATGEYRLARDGNPQLQRYQVTLPARATYPQVRAWVSEVMNEVPNAALDELSFRRDETGSDAVEARLRLTLFLKAP